MWSLFHVQLSESERMEMTPAPNNWEGDDGRYSKGSSRAGVGGEIPGDGSLLGTLLSDGLTVHFLLCFSAFAPRMCPGGDLWTTFPFITCSLWTRTHSMISCPSFLCPEQAWTSFMTSVWLSPFRWCLVPLSPVYFPSMCSGTRALSHRMDSGPLCL